MAAVNRPTRKRKYCGCSCNGDWAYCDATCLDPEEQQAREEARRLDVWLDEPSSKRKRTVPIAVIFSAEEMNDGLRSIGMLSESVTYERGVRKRRTQKVQERRQKRNAVRPVTVKAHEQPLLTNAPSTTKRTVTVGTPSRPVLESSSVAAAPVASVSRDDSYSDDDGNASDGIEEAIFSYRTGWGVLGRHGDVVNLRDLDVMPDFDRDLRLAIEASLREAELFDDRASLSADRCVKPGMGSASTDYPALPIRQPVKPAVTPVVTDWGDFPPLSGASVRSPSAGAWGSRVSPAVHRAPQGTSAKKRAPPQERNDFDDDLAAALRASVADKSSEVYDDDLAQALRASELDAVAHRVICPVGCGKFYSVDEVDGHVDDCLTMQLLRAET